MGSSASTSTSEVEETPTDIFQVVENHEEESSSNSEVDYFTIDEWSCLISKKLVKFYPPNQKHVTESEKFEIPFLHFTKDDEMIINQKSEKKFKHSHQLQLYTHIPSNWSVFPRFYIYNQTGYGASIEVPSNTNFYGGGNINNFPIAKNKILNLNIPFVLAVLYNGSAFGILINTIQPLIISISEAKVNIKTHPDLLTEKAYPFNIYIYEGDSPQEVLRKLRLSLGSTPLPPLWSFGLQCEIPDMTAETDIKLLEDLKKVGIFDSIWLEHISSYTRILNTLKKLNLRSIISLPPEINRNERIILERLKKIDFVLCSDKQSPLIWRHHTFDFILPDFTSQRTCDEWTAIVKDIAIDQNINGIYLLQSSLFSDAITLTYDAYHPGYNCTNSLVRNILGTFMSKSTFNAFSSKQKRAFIVTNDNFIGSNQYSITKLNFELTWSDLKRVIPSILNLSLCFQIVLVNLVVEDLSENLYHELLARWFGLITLMPFAKFILHRFKDIFSDGKIKEPFSSAINRRYKLVPYIYTLLWKASTKSKPIIQPVFFVDLNDSSLQKEKSAFLLGDIMVIPDVYPSEKLEKKILLPSKGLWYDFKLEDLDHSSLPILKIRGGSIIPTSTKEQSAIETIKDVTLVIAPDDLGKASGIFYLDSGELIPNEKRNYLIISYQLVETHYGMKLTEKRDGNFDFDLNYNLLIMKEALTYFKPNVHFDSGVLNFSL